MFHNLPQWSLHAFLLLLLPSLAGAQVQTFTTSWTNAGQTSGSVCRNVLTQDGAPIDRGAICFSVSEFQTFPGFSIYLPINPIPGNCAADGECLILESCTISTGAFQNVPPGDGTHVGDKVTQTSTFTCNVGYAPWTGSQTENFTKYQSTCRTGGGRYYHNVTCLLNTDNGGHGSVQTSYDPGNP